MDNWKLKASEWVTCNHHIDGILPKGPYPPCLRMAGRALLAGYHGYDTFIMLAITDVHSYSMTGINTLKL